MTVLDEEELVASAVVYPGSVEEVQKIVLWANKHLIPIFPISMGRNCASRSLPHPIVRWLGCCAPFPNTPFVQWATAARPLASVDPSQSTSDGG